MDIYVVCMDSAWVRDTQMFDMSGLSDDEIIHSDMRSEENAGRWHDMEPYPFIGIVSAVSEDEACRKAGTKRRCDPRSLFAVKIETDGGGRK